MRGHTAPHTHRAVLVDHRMGFICSAVVITVDVCSCRYKETHLRFMRRPKLIVICSASEYGSPKPTKPDLPGRRGAASNTVIGLNAQQVNINAHQVNINAQQVNINAVQVSINAQQVNINAQQVNINAHTYSIIQVTNC